MKNAIIIISRWNMLRLVPAKPSEVPCPSVLQASCNRSSTLFVLALNKCHEGRTGAGELFSWACIDGNMTWHNSAGRKSGGAKRTSENGRLGVPDKVILGSMQFLLNTTMYSIHFQEPVLSGPNSPRDSYTIWNRLCSAMLSFLLPDLLSWPMHLLPPLCSKPTSNLI